AYCAAASAAYLLNDVRDAPHDRLHPVKRERPVASCELAETVALLAAAGLAATALAAAGALGTRSFLFMLAFLALQGAYTVSLELVDRLVRIVAASTVASYALYTLLARDSKAMAATIPFVAFGVFRYMRLIDRDERGEEPESVLVSDGPLIATLVLWTATCAA